MATAIRRSRRVQGQAPEAPAMSRLSFRRSKSFIDRQLSRAIAFVFAACAVNNISLELLVKSDPGIGNTITASQFMFVALVGLISHVEWKDNRIGLKPRRSPMSFFIRTTSIFLVVSVINNVVFVFNISLPFHMLFRSCTLVVSMTLGLFVYGKEYSRRQIVSCLLITVGVLTATLADSAVQQSSGCCEAKVQSSQSEQTSLLSWATGVFLLLVSLVLSAILGHCQERGYRQYGRHPEENMFYSHMLALPFFVFLAPDIITRGSALISSSTTVLVPYLDIPVPLIALLGVNVVSQYVCVRAVYDITALSTTLTCTFTLTIRKFLSLIISVIFLDNVFTWYHWVGTILVFSGTVFYSLPREMFETDLDDSEMFKDRKTQ